MIRAIVLLILLICSYMFYHWVSIDENPDLTEKVEAQPNFIASNVTIYNYNNEGFLFEIIHADHAETYASADLTEMVNPSLTYYPEKDTENRSANKTQDANENWFLKADFGTLNSQDSIYLRSNVEAINSNKKSLVQRINSPYLELDFSTNEVRTPEMVYIYGNEFTNSGKGLTGKLDIKYFELLENCHASYTGTVSK